MKLSKFTMSILMILPLLSGAKAMATERIISVAAKYTCQQISGMQWVEVGIVEHPNGRTSAMVIEHNDSIKASILVADRNVTMGNASGGRQTYFDQAASIQVTINPGLTSTSAKLSVNLKDGRSIRIDDLVCTQSSAISYSREEI